ncbi:hypothetical protein CYG48_21560 (plasmid) [Neorhizobium sp. SOG26]|jgi:hypothetical protein|uniref:Uncharacterized protein n=1 Tax=Neorhizobium turbinariae TaxID=2937795 RepID=A0ABT0IPB0_9HYPH|nr:MULTISPECIES: hypothetical protein [Neorhizobium]AXV18325.1 hypothetical protein CYG48_21560 [Neorhizobium sp. SOG26]MCK8779712.1 hypothetical protein [Neorhizobium turbinariae]
MRPFFETTFGPAELEILDTVLDEWRQEHDLPKESPDVGLAAAVMINLFREGNDTVPALRRAVSEHKALADLI